MKSTTVNFYQVDVIFDASSKEILLAGEDVHGDKITIQPGMHVIQFSLSTIPATATPASFDAYSIQWTGSVPTVLPPLFPGWWDESHYNVVIFNLHREETQQSFSIKLDYQKQTFRHDPTIINEPVVQ
jgi:hypothetical protein